MKKLLIPSLVFSIIFGVMLLSVGTVSAETTLYVDMYNGNCDESGDDLYCTIQEAIDAASDGDTIEVAAGIYAEQILIDSKHISLIAVEQNVIIQPTFCSGHGDVIEIYNSEAIAAGVTVTVDGFIIDANYEDSGCLGGIYARGIADLNEGLVDVTILANKVYEYGKNGITVNGDLATATIEDNTVTGRGSLFYPDYAQNGIQLGWFATGTISENTISANDYDPGEDCAGTCTDWAGTGILLFRVDPETVHIPDIREANTFEGNEFDVLFTYYLYNQGVQNNQ